MPNFTRPATPFGGFESSTTAGFTVGALAETGDGRKFRFVKAGAVALVVGNALQSSVEDADHDAIVARATAAGSTELLITAGSGGGALDANEYAGGYAVIEVTPGLGYTYRISHHPAIAATANGSIFLDKADPIQVALTTDSRVCLFKNPWDGVIQMPASTLTGVVVGGAIAVIAAGSYGWIQTYGPGAALISAGFFLLAVPLGLIAAGIAVGAIAWLSEE